MELGMDPLSSTSADFSPGGAKREWTASRLIRIAIFCWVRGELISKATYGHVYLAVNATTGEMIAMKQVEMRVTRSTRNRSASWRHSNWKVRL